MIKMTKRQRLIDEIACTLVDCAVDTYGKDDVAKLREWATSPSAIEDVLQSYSYDNDVSKVTIPAVVAAVCERLA